MLPTGGTGSRDSRVEREEGGARRGVLQSGPSGRLERLRPGGEARVEGTGPGPEGEDPGPGEFEAGNLAQHIIRGESGKGRPMGGRGFGCEAWIFQ